MKLKKCGGVKAIKIDAWFGKFGRFELALNLDTKEEKCLTRSGMEMKVKNCKGLATQLFYHDAKGRTRSHIDAKCLKRNNNNKLVVALTCDIETKKEKARKLFKYKHGLVKTRKDNNKSTGKKFCLHASGKKNISVTFKKKCPKVITVTEKMIEKGRYQGADVGDKVLDKGSDKFKFSKNHMM